MSQKLLLELVFNKLSALSFVTCRYPAINKPAGIVHWLKHSKDSNNVDWVVILDADMIIRGPIIPWELGAEKGKPIAAYYGYEYSLHDHFVVVSRSNHVIQKRKN